MAYVKAATKHAMREKVSQIEGVYSCWIKRCLQSKEGTYDVDIHFSSEGLSFAILQEISRIFQTSSINVDGGYEDSGCPTCSGYPYVEVNVMGGTFSA